MPATLQAKVLLGAHVRRPSYWIDDGAPTAMRVLTQGSLPSSWNMIPCSRTLLSILPEGPPSKNCFQELDYL
ncbi:hypothetical protein B0H10DRAFT_2233029 [Mycena sp. CBHHK59/15]|nr:hypothetical protein B0H10DRAFT_2233029 [Mycena sp. CBHHK59/15]